MQSVSLTPGIYRPLVQNHCVVFYSLKKMYFYDS